MSDELAAFFAKKANKGKKKGVIKLQEVAEQLEKRAKIQDEIDELESKTSEETISSKQRNNNIENEDSEWLEFDEKPTLPSAVKEMEDFDIESEEEEKRSSAEPKKTWNVNNTENNETTLPPVMSPAETKYVPKAAAKAARTQFDIKNKMLFPTLGNASIVEKELKKEEEENIRLELEEKRRKEEEQRRIEEARAKRRVQQQDGETQQRRMERKQQQEQIGPTESDTAETWRREANQPPAANEEASPRKQHSERRAPEADAVSSWRSENGPPQQQQQDGGSPRKQHQTEKRQQIEAAVPQTESETVENWRSAGKSTTTTTPKFEPAMAIADQQPMESKKTPGGCKKTYIPPHLRNK